MSHSVDYDQLADSYDERYRHFNYDGLELTLLKFVGDNPGLQVLEVGCGTGHWLSLLKDRGFAVTGIDPSFPMLETSKIPVRHLVQGYAEQIPCKDKSFDRVICVNAIHHFKSKDDFISEAYRTLRPGGGLMNIGLDPHTKSDAWYIYDYFQGTRKICKRRYPPASSIRKLMQASGLSRCHTMEAQRIKLTLPARRAIEEGQLDKTITSQLVLLSDEEYQTGISRIWKAVTDAEAQGEPLHLIADLTLHATVGWMPA